MTLKVNEKFRTVTSFNSASHRKLPLKNYTFFEVLMPYITSLSHIKWR